MWNPGGGGGDSLAALQGHSKENESDPVDDGEPYLKGVDFREVTCIH